MKLNTKELVGLWNWGKLLIIYIAIVVTLILLVVTLG